MGFAQVGNAFFAHCSSFKLGNIKYILNMHQTVILIFFFPILMFLSC